MVIFAFYKWKNNLLTLDSTWWRATTHDRKAPSCQRRRPGIRPSSPRAQALTSAGSSRLERWVTPQPCSTHAPSPRSPASDPKAEPPLHRPSARTPHEPNHEPLPHPLHHLERPPARQAEPAPPLPPRSSTPGRTAARTRSGTGTRTHTRSRAAEQETSGPQPPTEPSSTEPLLYTAEQAAILLAVTPGWLRRAAGDGRIPSVLIGKHLRFARPDLDALIARGHRSQFRT